MLDLLLIPCVILCVEKNNILNNILYFLIIENVYSLPMLTSVPGHIIAATFLPALLAVFHT